MEESFDVNKAIALFKQGKGWTEIAKEFGVHPYSIQQKLNRLGYGTERSPFVTLDTKKAVRLKKTGMSYKSIATELGVPESRVQRAVSKVVGSRPIESSDRGVSFDVERAIELHNEGKGWTEIATELGVHPYSIQRKLQVLGYDTNPVRVGRKRGWDIEEAKSLRVKGITFKEIARMLGVNESTLQKGFKKVRKKKVI